MPSTTLPSLPGRAHAFRWSIWRTSPNTQRTVATTRHAVTTYVTITGLSTMPGLRAPPPGGFYLPDHARKRPFSAAREGTAKVPRPGVSRTMPILLDDVPRHIPPPQGQSCGNTNTFRGAAHERLLRRSNLATETARRQAVAEGRTQTRAMEVERDCERSALQLACVIPSHALAQLLGKNLAFLPIDEGPALLVAIIGHVMRVALPLHLLHPCLQRPH